MSILLWYGKHPSYLPWFLRSLAGNQDLHVLWVGDNPPDDLPSNATALKISLPDLCQRVSKRLGIHFQPENAYKLCDLKPALGLIFQEEIGEAEYWGPIDCDIILGDFRSRIAEIRSCDVFSCRERWFSASFAFLKNNQTCRELFMRSPDWKSVLENPACQLFDECGRSLSSGRAPFPELRRGKSLTEISLNCISFTHLLVEPASGLRVSFADRAKESLSGAQVLEVKSASLRLVKAGKSVFPAGSGFTHYHMVAEKTKPFFKIPAVLNRHDIPEEYYIAETGFYNRRPSYLRIAIDRLLGRIIALR